MQWKWRLHKEARGCWYRDWIENKSSGDSAQADSVSWSRKNAFKSDDWNHQEECLNSNWWIKGIENRNWKVFVKYLQQTEKYYRSDHLENNWERIARSQRDWGILEKSKWD